VVPLLPPPPGAVIVVFVDVVELVFHGCQTKSAIKIATTTTMTIPTAAALPPLSPSRTTTGPSAIFCRAPFKSVPPGYTHAHAQANRRLVPRPLAERIRVSRTERHVP